MRLAEKKQKKLNPRTTQPTTCTSSVEPNSGTVKPTTSSFISSAACLSPVPASSCVSSDSSSDSDNKIEITKETTGTIDKYGPLANLQASDYDIINDSSGWLNCDIVQAAQVLLQDVNPLIEGLQRPTLGRVRNLLNLLFQGSSCRSFIQAVITGSVLVIGSLRCRRFRRDGDMKTD